MEGELWKGLYRWVNSVASRHPQARGVAHSDAWVLLVLLWSVLHERPRGWACDPRNWPAAWRHRRLPSQATLSRRLRTVSLLRLLEAVLAEAWSATPPRLVKAVDARPLPVGPTSKDRDARRGQAGPDPQDKAKGYKLFAVCQEAGVLAWRIGPMNRPEAQVAERMVPEAAAWGGPGYLLGDGLYDTNPLHAVAWAWGQQLVAPRKRPGTGLGHRRHEPGRRRSIELLEGPGRFGRALYACRGSIERTFAQMSNFAAGLSGLPGWVRRPRRVALWIAGKLLIYAAWLQRPRR